MYRTIVAFIICIMISSYAHSAVFTILGTVAGAAIGEKHCSDTFQPLIIGINNGDSDNDFRSNYHIFRSGNLYNELYHNLIDINWIDRFRFEHVGDGDWYDDLYNHIIDKEWDNDSSKYYNFIIHKELEYFHEHFTWICESSAAVLGASAGVIIDSFIIGTFTATGVGGAAALVTKGTALVVKRTAKRIARVAKEIGISQALHSFAVRSRKMVSPPLKALAVNSRKLLNSSINLFPMDYWHTYIKPINTVVDGTWQFSRNTIHALASCSALIIKGSVINVITNNKKLSGKSFKFLSSCSRWKIQASFKYFKDYTVNSWQEISTLFNSLATGGWKITVKSTKAIASGTEFVWIATRQYVGKLKYGPVASSSTLRAKYMLSLYNKQGGKDALCNVPLPPLYIGLLWKRRLNPIIEIDHILPRAFGGSDEISNLQLTHRKYNRAKGTLIGHDLVKAQRQFCPI